MTMASVARKIATIAANKGSTCALMMCTEHEPSAPHSPLVFTTMQHSIGHSVTGIHCSQEAYMCRSSQSLTGASTPANL